MFIRLLNRFDAGYKRNTDQREDAILNITVCDESFSPPLLSYFQMELRNASVIQ